MSWTPPLLERDNSKNQTTVCKILKFDCFTVSKGEIRKWTHTFRHKLAWNIKTDGNILILSKQKVSLVRPRKEIMERGMTI